LAFHRPFCLRYIDLTGLFFFHFLPQAYQVDLSEAPLPFQLREDGYQGKYYGAAGVIYGYARQLARHFSLEFSLGIGYLTTEYKKYTPYEGDIIWTNSGRYNFIGPTKAKVSLVWLMTTKR